MSNQVGNAISKSEKINSLISELVRETSELEKGLDGVRPPQDSLVDSAKVEFDKVAKLRGRPLYFPYIGTGAGRGPFVELIDGSVKMDLINGIGIHLFGHGHPRLRAAALRGALSDVMMQGNLGPNQEYKSAIEWLVKLGSQKSRLKYAWLATCGTIANENALKMARQKNSPARLIISMENAFAGRSTMMAEVTDNPAYKQGLPDYNEVLRIPFYNSVDPRSSESAFEKFKAHVAANEKNISCFVFEPMLGEGGYKVAPRSFFVPILEFCKAKGIAVWADEVQTFMRTGEMFAFQTMDIGDYIDICTVAKTLQTGATLFTEEYNPKPGLVAGTFSGASAAMAAGIEAMKIMSEDGYLGPQGKVMKIHQQFVGMLNRLNETTCKGQLRDAGGLGLMVAVTPLDGSKDQVSKLLFTLYKNGLMTYSCGRDPYRLRFLIPAIMEESDIELAGQIIEKSIQELI